MRAVRLAGTIQEIVTAAGLADAFRASPHFHICLSNPPWTDLVIESWASPRPGEGRRISVAHYFEQNGDLVPDPEAEITAEGDPIEISQAFRFTPILRTKDGLSVDPHATRQAVLFLEMWGRNLRLQGFIDAARQYARSRLKSA